MKIYGISGLGADERVFQYLEIGEEIEVLKWLEPLKKESIAAYSNRLIAQINTSEDFILIGVSFGGIVAVELGKIINPKLIIQISSAETKNELRSIYSLFGKTGLIHLIPTFLFKPPSWIANIAFGARNKKLLSAIIQDTDTTFAKWAISQLITWDNKLSLSNIIKIHGTNDLLIPISKNEKTIILEEGTHFMIVDRGKEISEIIKNIIN